MSDCIGITGQKKECTNKTKDDEDFCWLHKYQQSIGKETLLKILSGIECGYKVCTRCSCWHNGKRTHCDNCRNKTKERNSKNKISCTGIRKIDGNQCINRIINDTKYCKDHQYMNNYTQEQIDNMRKCTGSCQRYIYWENVEFKSCDFCREIGTKNREKAKENDTEQKCINFEKCKNHANKELGSVYCGICNKTFIADNKKEQIIKSGKKVCSRWHHNKDCLEALNIDDPYESCEKCRSTENNRDTIKRNTIKNNAVVFNSQQSQDTINMISNIIKGNNIIIKHNQKIDQIAEKSSAIFGTQIIKKKKTLVEEHDECINYMCTSCNNVLDFRENFFDDNGNVTKNCKHCRDTNKELDKLYRKAEKQISVKTIDNLKKIRANNPELASLIYKLHRLNAMEKVGLDIYRKNCAEYAQQYRDNNPDIMEDQYADQRTSLHCVLLIYKKSSKKRNINWEITDDIAQKLFKTNCYYCGEIDLVRG